MEDSKITRSPSPLKAIRSGAVKLWNCFAFTWNLSVSLGFVALCAWGVYTLAISIYQDSAGSNLIGRSITVTTEVLSSPLEAWHLLAALAVGVTALWVYWLNR